MFSNASRRNVFTAGLIGAALFGLLRIAIAETGAAEQPNAAPWVAIPTGVADSVNKAVYITSASEGVEALDLATGHTLWENKQIHRPLAIADGKLIAIEPHSAQEPANTMGVAILDASNGHILRNSQPIVFPEWIAVEGGIGLGFTSTATVEDNKLKIYWHAWRQLVGGPAAQSAAAIAAARKDETGIATVDLESGRAEVKVEGVKAPKQAKGRFTDVGEIRLSVAEREEKVTGGVQIIRRTLEASDKRTGRPLWHHEIASDVIVPNNIPEQAQQQAQQQMQTDYDSRR